MDFFIGTRLPITKNSELEQIDILIIGAGVIGAAVANELSSNKKNIWVVEKHSRVAEGVTSRNSGVIHSGLYYPPQSHKASLCVRGKNLLYEWVKKHNVPYKQTGKVVIAVDKDEVGEIQWLYENAKGSGASGISLLGENEIKSKEPNVIACAALFAEETGIVDQTALTHSLLLAAESRGTMILKGTEVTDVQSEGSEFLIKTNRGPVRAQVVINASGLEATRIAKLVGNSVPETYPCRGDYFYLRPEPKLNHLVYPSKKKSAPGLGIHVTFGLDGSIKLGPDIDYGNCEINYSPKPEKSEAFRKAVERYLGPLPPHALHYDQCGLRPKLRSPKEKEEKDFFISMTRPGWVDLVGIESPGLTAAMAIAEKVKSLL